MSAFLLLASLLASASPSPAQSAADSVQTRLQRLADSVVAARPRMPGIIIAVEQPATGKRWSVAAGLSDTARRTKLTPDQPVRLASNTKTYTAAAVLRLVEMGRLALSDPLATRLPPSIDSLLRRDGYATDIITIEQVLNHRAGFNEHPAVPSYVATLRTDPQHHWTPREQLEWLVDSLAPVGPPGAQFRYSDAGYVLLGLIVERYSGQPLGPAVRSLVRLNTLGLRHTWWETLEPAPRGVPDRAHQYLGGFDAYGIDPSFDLYGGGGIVAPMADLAHFLTALLGGQVFDKRETLETMTRPRSPEMNGYGMGLFGSTVGGLTGRGHSGFWGTTAMVFPDAGVTIAVAITDQGEFRQSNAVMGAVLKLFGAARADSSADVRAIAASRARSNAAIATHDTAGIAREMMPDVTVVSSTSAMATGAAVNVSRMAAQFARRPDTRWVRTPETITVFDAWGVASERGQWVGTWTEPDGPLVIRGSYEAQWRRQDGTWRIQGELFVPLRCEGGAYCRTRPQ
ncbi:serine hydrolase [Gemmatimonas sp.]|uniref:serine hydrolase n=1 Tax=Gemmatimonas sp. TaxID=1962908 RepID=UPI00333F873D